MLERKEFTARVKAFSTERAPAMHKIYVDEYNAVRVWDNVAGHYTLCHSLSAPAQNRMRQRAAKI